MLDGEKHLISKDSWIIHVWLTFEISNLKSYLSFYLLRFQVSLVFLQCKYLEIIYCLPSFMLHTTMPFPHSLIVMQGPSGTLWVALFHLTNSLFYNLFDRLWIYLTIALSIKIVLYGFINSLPHLPSALVPSVKIIIITAASTIIITENLMDNNVRDRVSLCSPRWPRICGLPAITTSG